MTEIHTIFDKEKMDEAHARLSKQHIANLKKNLDQPTPGTVANLDVALKLTLAAIEGLDKTSKDLRELSIKISNVKTREEKFCDLSEDNIKALLLICHAAATDTSSATKQIADCSEALARAGHSAKGVWA